MKTLEESAVIAMDGSDAGLYPFIPYILQDTWEIGACPGVIIELVRKHTENYSRLMILDLGCGKGVVSIKLSKEFNCKCIGIDAIEEFIIVANNKAKEYEVDNLCKFEMGDIRTRINTMPLFDIIILGAIGPVFGDYYLTLTTLSKCLKHNGLIIIDDGYIENDSDYTHPLIQKKEIILKQVNESGMRLIDEVIIGREELHDSDSLIYESLKKRCIELIERHPDKSMLFENYIKKQEEENDILETKVVCSTMVIKKYEE